MKSRSIIPLRIRARLMRATVAARIGEKPLAAELRASVADYFYRISYKVRP